MNVINFTSAFCVLLILLSGCEDSINVIKGCCEEPAIKEKFGLGKIYIPNVFTPNDDGIHDRFMIQGDSVKQLHYVKIENSDGIKVFEILKKTPITDWNTSWDGKVNGRVDRGVYSYEVHAEAIDGFFKIFKGHVCVYPCNPETDKDIPPIKNCEFGPSTYFGHEDTEPFPCFDH